VGPVEEIRTLDESQEQLGGSQLGQGWFELDVGLEEVNDLHHQLHHALFGGAGSGVET
jgi:hypothetical protein